MNRSLRKKHAWVWVVLWPIFVIGIVVAITMSNDGPVAVGHARVGDSP